MFKPRQHVGSILVALVLTAFGNSQAQAVRPGGAPPKRAARAIGRLEPASGLIAVGVRPGTRIEQLKVKVGDRVKAGDRLAILEGRRQVDHQLDLTRKKRAIEREEFDRSHKAKLDAAEAVAKSVKERYDRAAPLYKALVSTLKDKERYDAEMTFLQLETQATQSELNVTLLKIAREMTEKQRKLEDDEMKSPFELEQTELRAPSDGTILEVKTHAGEISPGVVLNLGDTSTMVAVAEVFQTDVPHVAVGDPAEVRVLDRTVKGKVKSIGRTVSRNQMTSLDPRAIQDRRVLEVTVALDEPEPAAHYVNMQVDVLINPAAR